MWQMEIRAVISACLCLWINGGILKPVVAVEEDRSGLDDVVARARCAASCYEQYGYLPDHVDAGGYYEIVDEFCPDKSCEKCMAPCTWPFVSYEDCITNCNDDMLCTRSCSKLRDFSQEKEHNLTQLATVSVSDSHVVCMNVGSDCQPGSVYMYLSWRVTGRARPVPLVYAVEVRRWTEEDGSNNHWRLITTIPSTFAKIDNLSCSTVYEYRITPVSSSGVLGLSTISDRINTYSESTSLMPPTSLKVTEQGLLNQKPTITIHWENAQVSSCNLKIYWFDKHKVDQFEIKAPWRFQYNISELHFDTKYILNIHSANENFLHTSKGNQGATVRTPECLQSTMFNHTVCPPLQPRNLTAQILTKDFDSPDTQYINISLHWLPPYGTRNGSDVTVYHLSYRKEPPVFGAKHVIPHKGSMNVTSMSTSVVLYNIHNHNLYIFTLDAASVGGRGKETHLSFYFDIADAVINESTITGLRTLNESATMGSSLTEPSPHYFSVPEMVAVIVVPVVLLCGVLIVVLRLMRRNRDLKNGNQSGRQLGPVEEMNPIYEAMPLLFNDTATGKQMADGYEIDYSCLDFISVIGEGAFGKVVKAEFYRSTEDRGVRAGTIVAVKMLKDFYTGDESRSFMLEIQAMKNLGHHPHILGIIGCCLTGPKLCLVMDYCALGDLRNYLRKYREKLMYNMSSPYGMTTKTDCGFQGSLLSADSGVLPSSDNSERQDCHDESEITEAQLLSYARQITMGMEFLEQKKFIHRDLAARNVLLFDKRLVKISDFGLTRDVYETNMYQPTSARKLPYKWMAIESLFSQRFTIKSDVWSFGIVLWEIVTLGGSPYPSIPLKDLYGLLNDGYRMERPENCSKYVYKIMLSCWHPNPNSRPSFGQLREEIEKLLEETQSYIDLSVEVSGDYFNESTTNSQADMPPTESSENDNTQKDQQVTNTDDDGEYIEDKKLVVDIHDEPTCQKRNGLSDSNDRENLLQKFTLGYQEIDNKYPDSGLYCVFRMDNKKQLSTSEHILQRQNSVSTSRRSLHVTRSLDTKPSLKDNITSIMDMVKIKTFVTTPESRRRSVSLTDNKVTVPVLDCNIKLRSSVTVI